jgi:hypothetical protein
MTRPPDPWETPIALGLLYGTVLVGWGVIYFLVR